MHKGFRIVCVTPAGRRRYMRLLAPQILASPLVDRYDVWVNTLQPADLAFFDALAALDPRVRLVPQPSGKIAGSHSIAPFHDHATDADTIYIRFDDDIVWIQPDFFERFLEHRIANRDYLLTMPLIINNAVCTAVLAETGKVKLSRLVRFDAMDRIGWLDGTFAIAVHDMFLDLVERGDWARLHGGSYPIALNRFSINCISWFGDELARHPGIIGVAEEYDWTVLSSLRTGRANCIFTGAIASHYAFFTQRFYMDASPMAARYEAWLRRQPHLLPALDRLGKAVAEIDRAGKSGKDGGVGVLRPGWRDRLRDLSRRVRGRAPGIRLAETG